ncbi:MAG TPA: type III-B CRISPR module-associated protein Cmr3 [bacterium]|nr:type III-B CRISPR module-associated protein Cmr3 [bacterium]HPG46051.1 type III-B CRISPR module-associated protein Cmr3 [bacterium]HPM97873.1 type III-B CRISPR module-associated protein Cmr3 [bacterium]
MTNYIAYPFDVLYFRGNKSFDIGEWYSEGIFPPYPSTFQGFVRTCIAKKAGFIGTDGKIIEQKRNVMQSLVGDDTIFPFDLHGPFIVKSGQFFLPVPKDVLAIKNNSSCENHKQTIDPFVYQQIELSDKTIKTDLGWLHFPNAKRKLYYADNIHNFISLETLDVYRKHSEYIEFSESPIFTEEHIGIQLEERKNGVFSKQTREGHFYLTPYQRLADDAGLFFSVSDDNCDPQDCYSRLGSESRGAYVKKTDMDLQLKMDDDFYNEIVKHACFKLILLQPGIFRHGWLPFAVEQTNERIILSDSNVKLQLLYARTGGRCRIGGVSMRKQTIDDREKRGDGLKPMLNTVPAGSVYYLKIIEPGKDIESWLKQLDGNKLTGPESQNKSYEKYFKMGFNQAIIGKIHKN